MQTEAVSVGRTSDSRLRSWRVYSHSRQSSVVTEPSQSTGVIDCFSASVALYVATLMAQGLQLQGQSAIEVSIQASPQ